MWFPLLNLLAGEELKKKSELMASSILCGVNKNIDFFCMRLETLRNRTAVLLGAAEWRKKIA